VRGLFKLGSSRGQKGRRVHAKKGPSKKHKHTVCHRGLLGDLTRRKDSRTRERLRESAGGQKQGKEGTILSREEIVRGGRMI